MMLRRKRLPTPEDRIEALERTVADLLGTIRAANEATAAQNDLLALMSSQIAAQARHVNEHDTHLAKVMKAVASHKRKLDRLTKETE